MKTDPAAVRSLQLDASIFFTKVYQRALKAVSRSVWGKYKASYLLEKAGGNFIMTGGGACDESTPTRRCQRR